MQNSSRLILSWQNFLSLLSVSSSLSFLHWSSWAAYLQILKLELDPSPYIPSFWGIISQEIYLMPWKSSGMSWRSLLQCLPTVGEEPNFLSQISFIWYFLHYFIFLKQMKRFGLYLEPFFFIIRTLYEKWSLLCFEFSVETSIFNSY